MIVGAGCHIGGDIIILQWTKNCPISFLRWPSYCFAISFLEDILGGIKSTSGIAVPLDVARVAWNEYVMQLCDEPSVANAYDPYPNSVASIHCFLTEWLNSTLVRSQNWVLYSEVGSCGLIQSHFGIFKKSVGPRWYKREEGGWLVEAIRRWKGL